MTEQSGSASLIPCGLFFGTTLAVNFAVVNSAVFSGQTGGEKFWAVAMGSLIAQAGMVCVLAGLAGRAWLKGFLVGCGLAMLIALSLVVSLMGAGGFPKEALLAVICFIPLLVFAGAVPLLLVRAISGGCITRAGAGPDRASNSIEGLLTTTAVIAALLMLINAPQLLIPEFNHTDFRMFTLIYSLGVSVLSAVAVAPTAIAFFTATTQESRLRRLILSGGVSVGMVTTAMVVVAMFNGGTSAAEIVGMGILWALTATSLFGVGLYCLAASGFTWQPSMPAVAETSQDRSRRKLRIQNRFMTGAVVALVVVLNLAIQYVDRRRDRIHEEQLRLHARLAEDGGGLGKQENTIVELRLPRSAGDADLAEFQRYSEVFTLSLANTRITDAAIGKLHAFPVLATLDLSDTALTDAGLAKLPELQVWDAISLAGTRITVAGLEQTLGNLTCRSIDLGDLNLSDSDLQRLPLKQFSKVVLRGNPITDACLPELGEISELDLSDTAIDGTGLPALKQVQRLVLDGTAVTDAPLTAYLPLATQLEHLSLLRTQATLATVAAATAVASLTLGDGAIDENDLDGYFFACSQLALPSKRFTGRCFSAPVSSINTLDLGRSAITDDTLSYLANLTALQSLNLSETAITDAGLDELSALPTYQIGFARTGVTAAGLIDSDLRGRIIHVGIDQFTAAELKLLRQKFTVVFGDDGDWMR